MHDVFLIVAPAKLTVTILTITVYESEQKRRKKITLICIYINIYILYIYIYKFYTDFSLCPENVKPINVIVRIVIVINSGKLTITILTITLVH